MEIGFVGPVNQALVFFNFSSSWRHEVSLSCFSEKYEMQSLDVHLGVFFVNLHLHYFLSFPGLTKCFKWGISHALCLHKLLFNFGFFSAVAFCLAVLALSNRSISSSSASSISVWLDSGCFILCFPFWFIFFSNSFQIVAILSHASPISTHPWRCIQGWICRISLKNKISLARPRPLIA